MYIHPGSRSLSDANLFFFSSLGTEPGLIKSSQVSTGHGCMTLMPTFLACRTANIPANVRPTQAKKARHGHGYRMG